MSEYKYTIYDGRKNRIVSVDDIAIAREAIEELEHGAYIQYNESGIKEFQESQS